MSILDRKDGKRVKLTNGMSQLMLDINPKRCDSEDYIDQKVDVTELVKYMKKKKKDNPSLTFFHAFMAAMGKVMYNRPKLNYFVANRHVYEHKNVVLSFVAKVAFEDHSEELMLMIPMNPDDTIDTLSVKIKERVDKIRTKDSVEDNNKKNKKGANSAVDVLGKLPNIIRVPLVGFLKWTDKHGWLPSSLMDDNIYFSSMIITNLGAIGGDAIYHHLAEFGTCSSLTSIGKIREENVIIDGKEEKRSICDFGITLDERIADGYYFVKSIQLFQYILNHPEMLDEELSKVVEMPK